MKVVVCIKQVPDTKGGVKFNPERPVWCGSYSSDYGASQGRGCIA